MNRISSLATIVRLSQSVKPTLQVAIERTADDKLVYASIRLSDDYNGEMDIDAMLAHLEAGNKNKDGVKQLVKVSIPPVKDVSLRVRLSPIMTGENAAIAIRELSGHHAAPTPLTPTQRRAIAAKELAKQNILDKAAWKALTSEQQDAIASLPTLDADTVNALVNTFVLA